MPSRFLTLAVLAQVMASAVALAAPPAAPTSFSAAMTKTSQSSSFPHTYVFLWTDNASDETGFQIDYRIGTSGTFNELAKGIAANTTGTSYSLQALANGTTIQFRVRAYKGTEYSNASNTSSVTVPATTFNPPSNVAVTPQSESVLRVTWNDNSTSEDGWELEMLAPGGTWSDLGDIFFYQTRSIDVTGLSGGTPYQFRLRAYRDGTPRTYTAYSSASTATMTNPPNAPSSLAVTVLTPTSASLTWTDNSSVETGYEVLARVAGSGNFPVKRVAAAGSTSTTLVNLPPGASMEFAVRARADGPATFAVSANSNVVTRLMRDAITSPLSVQAVVGRPFSYTLTTSSGTARASWNATGLPGDLSFDNGTGIISGTPTGTGVHVVQLQATFAGNSDSQTLVIRVQNPPVVASVIPSQNLVTGTPLNLPLTGAFDDPDVTTAVKVTTTLGTMDFILFESATPQTVANFVAYMNSGAYNNNLFHRSVPGFVIQGGAFKPSTAPYQFTSVTTLSPVQNEPGISNLRGSIAMAKLPDLPNSATDQFFINLDDNSGDLDSQNGGFTVFGRVAGGGMAVADAIAALPIGNYSIVLDGTVTSYVDWPLNSPDALAAMDNTKVAGITSVAVTGEFTYAVTGNTNPAAITAAVSSGNLVLTPLASGEATITVEATNLDGFTVSQSFSVDVISNVATLSSLTPSQGSLTPAFTPANGAYAVSVPYTATGITLTPTLTEAHASVTVNGVPVISGSPSATLPLQVGANAVNLLVTAEDGTTTKPYTVTVTRLTSEPLIGSPSSADVGTVTATLGGEVSADGGASISESGVVYARTSVNGNPAIGGTGVTKVAVSPATGSFTVPVTGLSPGVAYSFRAYSINSVGTGYSAAGTFTTEASEPGLSSPTSSAVLISTAILGGNAASDGGATISERGVICAPVAINSTPQLGGPGVLRFPTTGTTGVFTVAVTGLTPFTPYAFRAYAINRAGTGYSPVGNFTTLSAAELTSPTPGSVLGSTSVTFAWNPGNGATAYWLYAGSSPGGSNYRDSGQLSATVRSQTVSGLPVNGSPVYIRLFSKVGGSWVTSNYTFTSLTGTKAVMSAPPLGSTFTGSSATFTWDPGLGASGYWLYVGSSPGATNYHNSGTLSSSVLSRTVSGLPVNGSTVYVRLFTKLGSSWVSNDYTYQALAATKATLSSPANGSTLTAASASFVWNPGTGASAYWLYVGSSVGAKNYYDSGSLGSAVLGRSASGLPIDGSTIYVRLWTQLSGAWVSNDYSFTAYTDPNAPSKAVLSTPATGSPLTSDAITFAWNAGNSAAGYWLYVGSARGTKNFHDSGQLSSSVLSQPVRGLPSNGSTIHVRLYTKLGSSWVYNDYSFTAWNGRAFISSPSNGSALPEGTVPFTWNASSLATGYWLYVGSSPGAKNYLDSAQLPASTLNRDVPGLPNDGSTIYVRLWTLARGSWLSSDTSYQAAPPP